MKPIKKKTARPMEIPFEDRHQTKEIVRLQMQRIALGIQLGSPLSEMHQILQETRKEIGKLGDSAMQNAFQKLQQEILGNWPIQTTTPWDHLETIGRLFAFIDQKTVY